jgi:hypothetical protein
MAMPGILGTSYGRAAGQRDQQRNESCLCISHHVKTAIQGMASAEDICNCSQKVTSSEPNTEYACPSSTAAQS